MALLCQYSILAADPPSQMRAYLQQQVSRDPEDAASRRLLGRCLLEDGDLEGAIAALQIAAELDPLSAAAHYDLGRALFASDDLEGAAEQWRKVQDVSPESDYAAEAEARIAELPEDIGLMIKTVGYEIREFPGPPGIKPIEEPPATPAGRVPVFLRLEIGLLYNSNVALAPSSRQLAAGDRQSFQLFASPEIEWWAVSNGNWVAGPLLTGQFTANEEAFQNYNLSSISPGIFAEWADDREAGSPVFRCEYRYGLDQFEGSEFSQRHSVLGRLTTFDDNGGITSGYIALDHTNFVDDGILPEVTSADGFTYAIGAAREIDPGYSWMRHLRFGLDLDRLDSSGTDFAYWGAGVTGQSVHSVVPSVDVTLRAGVGYRVFDRYQFEPDRDELIWRTGCELRKWITPELSIASIVNYQTFDSGNPLFAADRLIAGVTIQYLY